MSHPLSGVYAAMVTPLKTPLEPDLEAVPSLLRFLADRGCHGALVFGTTGEGPSFSPEERIRVWEQCIEIKKTYPHFRLFAGTGTPSLSETIDLTKAAFRLGFDAALVLPPYYFRKASDDGLFDWFAHLIEQAVPKDKSVIAYHIPAVSGVGFSLDLLVRLREKYPQQFAGIKDSSHDLDFTKAVLARLGPQFAVFTGTDSHLLPALGSGAAGAITAPANIISPALRKVYESFHAGAGAQAAHEHASDLRHFLEQFGPFPPSMKQLLHTTHGFPLWPVRPPLSDLAAPISGWNKVE